MFGAESKFLHYKLLKEFNIYPLMLLDSFVHHNGNTTTDEFGRNFKKDFDRSENLLKQKIEQYNNEDLERVKVATKIASEEFSILAIRDRGIGDIIMS